MASTALNFISTLAVFVSILVITAQNPVIAVIYLIGVFVIIACYLVCLGIPFIGLSYLIVYVGAVAVLFLFVIMMLNVRLSDILSIGYEYTKSVPLGAIFSILFLLEFISLLPSLYESRVYFPLDNNMIYQKVKNIIFYQGDVSLTFPTLPADGIFTYFSQVQTLGLSLYTYGSLWLLLLSVVLLLSIIGPIALCLRPRKIV